MPLRVLVADGHPSTRLGVSHSLRAVGLEVCATAASADGAVTLAEGEHPDVCLLDVDMPGGGVAAARRIDVLEPRPRIVLLGGPTDAGGVLEAVLAGADGYLPKAVRPAGLVRTLEAVARGEVGFPRSMVGLLVDEVRHQDRRRRPAADVPRGWALTSREWEVLRLLAEGRRTEDVARWLGRSPVTVRRHVSSALAKLRVPDRAAAIELLREAGAL